MAGSVSESCRITDGRRRGDLASSRGADVESDVVIEPLVDLACEPEWLASNRRRDRSSLHWSQVLGEAVDVRVIVIVDVGFS
jgi:hypothetical protein